ncbi:phage portal protein [Kitasatospora sp. McL0602]|uniref:phage portal protein n=1 Tax=Kitasatospora sp. McL0602 TaxID=3439530 RepID=UPI003F8CA667
MTDSVVVRAQHGRELISRDYDRLNLADRYYRGLHRAPWMPRKANAEFKDLVKRSILNLTGLIIDTPSSALRVDGFRRPGSGENAPEWKHWQKNRLDSRQRAVHKAAFVSGAAYVAVTPDPRRGRKGPVVRGFDAINTTVAFQDPTMDEFPLYAVHVPENQPDDGTEVAMVWDDRAEYRVVLDGPKGSKVVTTIPHDIGVCPVVRFAPETDLRGRCRGLVDPLIVSQDRLNQQVLSLLLSQHWGAHAIRFGTGLAPTEKLDPETGDPVCDPETGEPVYEVPLLDPSALLMAPNSDAKFGQLPASPTGDLQKSIRATMEEMTALGDVPPHHLMADMVNLSADAMAASESSFKAALAGFQESFGESWETVLRLCAVVEGGSLDQDESQVEWADKSMRSLGQAADAMTKLMQQGVPLAVALRKVPGFTQSDIDESVKAAEEAAAKEEAREQRALDAAKETRDGVDTPNGRRAENGGGVQAGAKRSG